MSKKYTSVVLVVVLILLVAGFFVWKKSPTATAPVNPPTSVSQQNTPPATPTNQTVTQNSEPIFKSATPFQKAQTEWVAYTSKQYGFSVQYPKGWTVDEKHDNGILDGIRFWSPQSYPAIEKWRREHREALEQGPEADITIQYETETNPVVDNNSLLQGAKTIEQFIQEHPRMYASSQKISIDNEEGWIAKTWDSSPSYSIFVKHNGATYEMSSPNADVINTSDPIDFTREFISYFHFSN